MNSTWKRFALAIPVFFFVLGSPLNVLLATDYFVSGTGNDANNGLSSGTAFRTLTRGMQGNGGGLQPGDRLLVGPGIYDSADGETFPIVIPDGATILGPGDGTAVVSENKGPGFLDLFRVGSLANTTVIQGMSFQSDTTGTSFGGGMLIYVNGNPADLQVIDNRFTGGSLALWHPATTLGTPAGLTFQENTVSGSLNRGVFWGTSEVAGSPTLRGSVPPAAGTGPTHSLVFHNNTFTGIGHDGIKVVGVSGAFLDVTVTNNVMDGFGDDAIDFNAFSWTSSMIVSGVYLVENNTIRNAADKGLTITASATGTNGVARADLTFRNNVVEDCGRGLELSCMGTESGLGEILGLVEFNTFTGNGRGFNAGIFASSSGTASFHPTLRYNCIAGATDGMVFNFSQTGGMIDFSPQVFGNLFLGNTGDEVRVTSSWIEEFSSIAFAPDFGGGSTLKSTANGLNIFEGRDPGTGGDYDFEFGFGPSSFGVPAKGNWWGTFSGSVIEEHVFHNADNGSLGTVDYTGFLNPNLGLITNQKTIKKKGGERLTVTAGSRSAFLAQAGNKMFTATLNGIPVINPVISPDHSKITFTTPDLTTAPPLRGTSPTSAVFTLTLPGATVSGGITFKFSLKKSSKSGGFNPKCFLTTAAYGDRTAPEIGMFRRWRDESLAGNPLGRQLVRAYYAASPPLAEYVAAHPPLRAVSRAILAPVLGAVRLWMDAAWVYGLAGLFLAWGILRRRTS